MPPFSNPGGARRQGLASRLRLFGTGDGGLFQFARFAILFFPQGGPSSSLAARQPLEIVRQEFMLLFVPASACCRFFLSKNAQINGAGQVGEGAAAFESAGEFCDLGFCETQSVLRVRNGLMAPFTCPAPSIRAFPCPFSDKVAGGLTTLPIEMHGKAPGGKGLASRLRLDNAPSSLRLAQLIQSVAVRLAPCRQAPCRVHLVWPGRTR